MNTKKQNEKVPLKSGIDSMTQNIRNASICFR